MLYTNQRKELFYDISDKVWPVASSSVSSLTYLPCVPVTSLGAAKVGGADDATRPQNQIKPIPYLTLFIFDSSSVKSTVYILNHRSCPYRSHVAVSARPLYYTILAKLVKETISYFHFFFPYFRTLDPGPDPGPRTGPAIRPSVQQKLDLKGNLSPK